MSMTEEERRRARAEASRRCRERKAAMAAAVKNKNKSKAKPAPKAEAKPAARPAQKQPDPLKAAERVVKRFAKVAAGIKPMLRESADVLSAVYKTEDEKTAAKVERLLAKSLGVVVGRLPSDSYEKTRVCLDASSKTVKTPAFRLEKDGPAFEPFPAKGEQAPFDEDFDEEAAGDEPSESVEAVPVDPMSLAKIESGEAAPEDADEDDLDVDELLENEDGEEDDEDDEDEEDEDDESEAAAERRSRRRAREDADNERDWASGRWEMMGEMGAQGAFDD